MPINIPNDLPAWNTLEQENIFIMSEKRASSQDIRPRNKTGYPSSAHFDSQFNA